MELYGMGGRQEVWMGFKAEHPCMLAFTAPLLRWRCCLRQYKRLKLQSFVGNSASKRPNASGHLLFRFSETVKPLANVRSEASSNSLSVFWPPR